MFKQHLIDHVTNRYVKQMAFCEDEDEKSILTFTFGLMLIIFYIPV